MLKIIERSCGWCGKALAEDATLHVLECPEQPLAIYRKALMEELEAKYCRSAIPDEVTRALKRAYARASAHIIKKHWKFEKENPHA